jgi:hypothetical protein
MKKIFITLAAAACLFFACDSDHSNEFNKIDRRDVARYEAFIRKYPESRHVQDAQERIEAALEQQRLDQEFEKQMQLEYQYRGNSLPNNSEPYSNWYGSNAYYDDYTPHSEINVRASSSSDVIVIVRYNNSNGAVAGHRYIKAGCSGTIYLKNQNRYQVFFYHGNGWYPGKAMGNGIVGGFVKDESFTKDESVQYLNNEILTYTLTQQQFGNFAPGKSNQNEIF